MDEKDWLILYTLYNERNITRTAQRLYVSQPALTYRIQQIEHEFKAEIIVRKRKGIEFTEEGEQIALYAQTMLLELKKVKDRVANSSTSIRGVLRLGVSSTFAHYQLPELLKNFLDRYPDVEINLKTGWSSEVMQAVQKEEVHIGIVRGENHWQEQKYRLFIEPIYIVSRQELKLEQLPNIPRINYKTDFPLKVVIDNWWQSTFKATPPLITMEVDNIQTCKELVKKNLGFAILPNVCLLENDKLHTYPLQTPDGEAVLRNTWLICRDNLLELTVIRTFFNFAQEYFAK